MAVACDLGEGGITLEGIEEGTGERLRGQDAAEGCGLQAQGPSQDIWEASRISTQLLQGAPHARG